MSNQQVYIYDWCRTPRGRGRFDGSLYQVKPIELLRQLFQSLQKKCDLDTQRIDDVILGCVSAVGEQGGDIARIAPLYAGYNVDVCGVTLNRFCASGLEAFNMGAAKIAAGMDNAIIVGGVESMSRVPMLSDGGCWYEDPLINQSLEFVPQGISADLIATLEGFTREELDQVAVDSHTKAAKAWEKNKFGASVVPISNGDKVVLEKDETIRPDCNLEDLAKLKPSFEMPGKMGFDNVCFKKFPSLGARMKHFHHAGNSSGIVDGACIMLLGNEQFGKDMNLKPRARYVSSAQAGTDPTLMLVGPTPASQKALKKAGLKTSDMDLIEINEAFASVVLRFVKDMQWDPEKVNPNGGSIAMGHPLGATGTIILGTLLDELAATQKKYGLASLCVGAGMGVSAIIESNA